MKDLEIQMSSIEEILALPDEQVLDMLDMLLEFINEQVDEAFDQ